MPSNINLPASALGITTINPSSLIVPSFPCPQHAVPAADISTGTWTPSTGSTLYDMIDEEILNQADYISSSDYASQDTAKVTLSPLLQPGDGNTTVFVWVRRVLG